MKPLIVYKQIKKKMKGIIFIGFHITSFKDNLELTKLFLALSNNLIV
jgi:hypothetical protein